MSGSEKWATMSIRVAPRSAVTTGQEVHLTDVPLGRFPRKRGSGILEELLSETVM